MRKIMNCDHVWSFPLFTASTTCWMPLLLATTHSEATLPILREIAIGSAWKGGHSMTGSQYSLSSWTREDTFDKAIIIHFQKTLWFTSSIGFSIRARAFVLERTWTRLKEMIGPTSLNSLTGRTECFGNNVSWWPWRPTPRLGLRESLASFYKFVADPQRSLLT